MERSPKILTPGFCFRIDFDEEAEGEDIDEEGAAKEIPENGIKGEERVDRKGFGVVFYT